MECSLSYFLLDEKNKEAERGEGKVSIDEQNLYLSPAGGSPMSFSHREIVNISEGEYRISISLNSGEVLVLYDLGYSYEDFIRVLSKLMNQLTLKDMLMEETLKKSGIDAEFSFYDASGTVKQSGRCELMFYETAFVVIPEKGGLSRIPASEISEVRDEDYTIIVNVEDGEKLVFSKIGGKFDYARKAFSELMNDLSLRTQSTLRDLAPSVNSSVLRKASFLLKDGKAARRSDLDSVSPQLLAELEKKLSIVGIKESYDFLASMGQRDRILIGVKRGLMGSLTGDYLWFLIPIYSLNPEEPGNIIAMEAGDIPKEDVAAGGVEGQDGGEAEGSDEDKMKSGKKATYFFRITSRKDYGSFRSIDDLHCRADSIMKAINRCMLDINFRREPIYLPDERLDEPQYEKYRFSLQKIPALKMLRQLFIGRVMHSSPEQWKQDVSDLLKFNVSAQDDELKWVKKSA